MEEIIALSTRHAREVVEICERQFGAGYFCAEHLSDGPYQIGLWSDGKLVSICLADRQTSAQANANVMREWFSRPVLFVHTIATAAGFQQMGYASRLIRHLCERHRDMDFYATAWTSHGVVHAEKTFAEAGFRKEHELALFYAGDGAPSGCHVCGDENVCSCSAWLFTRMARPPEFSPRNT